ncbi:hypothetical protein AAZX31_20G040700 [Glycine max]
MISFYVSYGRYEGKSSAVILKFELFHTPTPEIRSKIARKGNFQNVELQVDSLAVVKSITGNNEGSTNA